MSEKKDRNISDDLKKWAARTSERYQGFKNEYDKLYRKNPAAANVLLLLTELADEKGKVVTDDKELAALMALRFDDPTAYQLPGGYS